MSWWGTTLGLMLGAGLAAGFPALLRSVPDEPDLRAVAASSKPFVVRDTAGGVMPRMTFVPWPMPEGFGVTDTAVGTGLDLRTWSITYSHRWERSVTLPVLTGPFITEGQDVCGYSLRLGAGLFDAHGAGAGIESLFREKLAVHFGRDVQFEGRPFHLPNLSTAHLHIVPQSGAFLVEVNLGLVDGTRFAATFRARVDNDNGSPVVRRAGPVQGSWHMTPDLLISNTKAMEALFEQRLADSEMFKHPIGGSGCTETLPKLKPGGVHLDVAKESNGGPGDVLRIALSVDLVDGSRIDLRFRLRLLNLASTPTLELLDLDAPGLVGAPFDRLRNCAQSTGAGYGAVVGLLGCFLGPWGCAAGVAVGAGVGSDHGEETARADAFKTVNDQLKAKLGELNSELATSSGALFTKNIDDGLQEANLGLVRLRAPFAPLPTHARDTLAVRLGGVPQVSPSGIVIPLCARVEIGEGKVDASIPGFVDLPCDRPTFAADLALQASTVELAANADGIDQLLYFLWQSGTLGELGTSRGVLDALPKDMQALAFDFSGFDPGLPPTVSTAASTSGAIGLSLGDVKIGTWDSRRVVAHAVGALAVQSGADGLGLSYALSKLTANCTEPAAGATALTPCLSDLLPAVREQVASRSAATASPCDKRDADGQSAGPPAFCVKGGDVLGKLTEQLGGLITFSRLDATTQGNPAQAVLRVEAQISGGSVSSAPTPSAAPTLGSATSTGPGNDGADAKHPVLPAQDVGFVDTRGGWGWGDRCWNNMKLGKWGWAKAECDQGMAMNPASPQPRASLLYNEGLVAKAAGNVDEARRDFVGSLALRENAEVRAALKGLSSP